MSKRCNCDASCGENRYHPYGSNGCKHERVKLWCDYCGPCKSEEIYRLQGRLGEFQLCYKCLQEYRV